jgi:lipid A 3-O-deacylase
MLLKRFFIIITSYLTSNTLLAQYIDNTPYYKYISNEGYFRLSYDNDFFSATDQYYTQGIDAELVLPQMSKLFTNKLLLRPKYRNTYFGVGLQHNGFTPASISSDDILYNDRPFAAVLLAKTFAIALDPIRKQRFSSSLYLGVIGHAAGAKEMQEYIHDKLNNITPHGWQHQINNDLALNYQVHYEKQILTYKRLLSVSVGGGGNAGTLNIGASGTISVIAGYFTNPYDAHNSATHKWSVYGYLNSEGRYIVYNASLQGGMLNKRSPYTLSATEITRAVARLRYGVRLSYSGIYLEYFKALQTREFETGKPHAYGGLQIGTAIPTSK